MAVVTGIGGLIVSAIVTPFITLHVARRGDATTRRGQDLTKSQSDRDLIKLAVALARSARKKERRQGLALLSGLARMTDLSQDDAILVESMMLTHFEVRVSEARAALSSGSPVEFEVEQQETGFRERGSDGDRDQGD